MPRVENLVPRLAVVAFAVTLVVGCERPSAPPPPPAAPTVAVPAKSATSTTYTLKGVIKRVHLQSGQVVIAHEAIPGFMEAMTMPFTLKDHSLLEDMRAGDEVEGPLRVDTENGEVKDYELTDLLVTRPALAAPRVLSFSEKGASLNVAPQRLELGQAVPDFAVTMQDGQTRKLSDWRGNVVVLTFIYTRCPLPDFCPLMDRKFEELASKLDLNIERSQRVRLVSVSFDPEHDTPDVLRKHAQLRGARPPLWTFAVASHDELAKVAGPLGLTYGPRPEEILHNLCTAVIAPDGRLAKLYVGPSGKTWTPAEVVKEIATLLGTTPADDPAK